MSDITEFPDDGYPEAVTTSGSRIPIDQLLRVDPSNIRPHLETHAAWQAVISHAASVARLKVEISERHIKELESEKFIHYYTILSDKMGKPPSVDVVKHNVANDSEVRHAYKELFARKYKSSQLEDIRFSMHTRKEMLINLSAESRLDRRSEQRS